MTFEEAEKILEKEGFVVGRFTGVLVGGVRTASWEKTEVSEAMRVVAGNGYLALMEESRYGERKARLKKEYGNGTKAPVSGEVKAGDGCLEKATDAFILQADEIMRLKKKNAELPEAIDNMKEGTPAPAGAASRFNDARALKSAGSVPAYRNPHIEKLKDRKVINDGASMEAIARYADAVSKAELDGLELESWKNDGREITSVYQLKNGRRRTLSLVHTGEGFLFRKTDSDRKRRVPTPEASHGELMKIQEKAAASHDVAGEGGNGMNQITGRCTKNGTELHYSEKDGFTYTNMYGEEVPVRCLRSMFRASAGEENENMKK